MYELQQRSAGMNVCGVDLAARFSAFVLIGPPGHILAQAESWGVSPSAFLGRIVDAVVEHDAVLVCEDLPPRVPWSSNVKEACRLQGRLDEKMSQRGSRTVHYYQPAAWQRFYINKHGLAKKSVPVSAWRTVAASYGYQPPNLMNAKVESDYVDAFLIAKWASLTTPWETSS